jgi:hypothetical protein
MSLTVTPFMLDAARVFSADVVEQILDELEPERVQDCSCTERNSCSCNGQQWKSCPCYSSLLYQYGEVAW